ncbi:hypothetical protein [Sulfitobacter sp.]|uniref:hypothetical protein n=1 Tax=Sulfitobacter sp. TaxID=1903071 RepID=UPI0030024703
MKSNLSTINTVSAGPQFRHLARQAASSIRNGVSKIRARFSSFHTSLKIGRMEAVLGNLSDEQLAQVGVKRSGIKRHAEYLIGYEYDGL